MNKRYLFQVNILLLFVLCLSYFYFGYYVYNTNYNIVNGCVYILRYRKVISKELRYSANGLIKDNNSSITVNMTLKQYDKVRKSIIKKESILPNSFMRSKLDLDLDFARRLRQAQKDTSIPLVNDIIVNNDIYCSLIYVIINNGNAIEKYWHLKDLKVDLIINGKAYHNLFRSPYEYQLRVLKYKVPFVPFRGRISLFDRSTYIKYENLPYISIKHQNKGKIAICAYISDYNTKNEIKSFLAYYLIQKIDRIIFYCSTKYDYFSKILKKEIECGFVVLYEYPWPLTKAYGPVQRSVQGSHINSCYYRHRNYFQYIISQDVDEYFYSELYPYDLYSAIKLMFRLHRGKKSLAVFIIVMTYL